MAWIPLYRPVRRDRVQGNLLTSLTSLFSDREGEVPALHDANRHGIWYGYVQGVWIYGETIAIETRSDLSC